MTPHHSSLTRFITPHPDSASLLFLQKYPFAEILKDNFHQEFQVPKMEGFLNLIFGHFLGVGFPYISRIHTAYIGEDSSILGTTSMFGETFPGSFGSLWNQSMISSWSCWGWMLEKVKTYSPNFGLMVKQHQLNK